MEELQKVDEQKRSGIDLINTLSKFVITPSETLMEDDGQVKLSKSLTKLLLQAITGVMGGLVILVGFTLLPEIGIWIDWIYHGVMQIIGTVFIIVSYSKFMYFDWYDVEKAKKNMADKLWGNLAVPLLTSIQNHNARIQELIDLINIQIAFDASGESTKLLMERIQEKATVVEANRDRLSRIHSKYDKIRLAHKNTIASLQLVITEDSLLSEEELELNHLTETINSNVKLQVQ